MSTNTVKTIKGPTIMLHSGEYFDILDPRSSRLDIQDIAHGLSNVCRFAGQCADFYSVAQHSVLVSYNVPPEHAFAGLMHDAAEAMIGDVSKPLKVLLPEYQRIEHDIEQAIFERYGLPAKLPSCVKQADLALLRTEQRDLMHADRDVWTYAEGAQALPVKIVEVPPRAAKNMFLGRFYQLTGWRWL